jgi:hypothetical protein
LRALKIAFESILDEHARHPKRPKKLNEEKYIILNYDYKNKKYFIVEESSEED